MISGNTLPVRGVGVLTDCVGGFQLDVSFTVLETSYFYVGGSKETQMRNLKMH